MTFLLKKYFFTDFENEPCEGESSICEGTCQCIPCSPLGQSSEPTSSTVSLPMTSSSLETQWTSSLSVVPVNSFTSPTGPTVAIPDSPVEVFQLFYTDQIFEEIVFQTNEYAKEMMDAKKYEKWKPICLEDLKAFFGFNILMGLVSLPSVEDYWKRTEVYDYGPIADRISSDRYREISRYLHFVDNSTLCAPGSSDYDRLGKVRPLLEHLKSKFASNYYPSKELAVDEAMIKFQGRSSLKQYMPQKPIKRGIKVWVLADSRNGFFSRLEVYTGRKRNTEHGLGERVVKDLTLDFQGKWHWVFFDNFFTSKKLLCDLESVGIYGCGTARKDRRDFPEQLKKPKLKER